MVLSVGVTDVNHRDTKSRRRTEFVFWYRALVGCAEALN